MLVGAIDQGTSSSRVCIFDNFGKSVAFHQEPVTQLTPQEGWVEMEPREILDTTLQCISSCVDELYRKEFTNPAQEIKAIGVTNQRETLVCWDKVSGLPLASAIVWLDQRTASLAERLVEKTSTKSKDHWRYICGLPIHPYFTALKLRWLIDNSPEVRHAIAENRCLAGTVDSWLIWNLTGGIHGGIHVTDVTNASRTMLMNLETLKWDNRLLKFFEIPAQLLPDIRSSSEVYGYIKDGPLKGVPIAGCLGDQQAALVGHGCFTAGQVKNTYGTGCFLLYNTGDRVCQSSNGLLTTIAYQLGSQAPAIYALEGSIAVAGVAVRWLRDNLDMIHESSEIETFARSVQSTHGVYFVPAFSGLYAPYWEPAARGLICGLSQYTTKHHLCRAVLEAICFQTAEILEAMNQDSKLPIKSIQVDGGMTCNRLLLDLQADILGIDVHQPESPELTALGAARAAGLAVGVWNMDMIRNINVPCNIFSPKIDADKREQRIVEWKDAIRRTMPFKKERKWLKWIFGCSGFMLGLTVASAFVFTLFKMKVFVKR